MMTILTLARSYIFWCTKRTSIYLIINSYFFTSFCVSGTIIWNHWKIYVAVRDLLTKVFWKYYILLKTSSLYFSTIDVAQTGDGAYFQEFKPS